MKLKIWEDEEGHRHTSLDDMEISNILMELTLHSQAKRPTEVDLVVAPSSIEVIAEAKVNIIVGDKRYRLKE